MKWGNVQLLYWLPLAIPLAWALFALLRHRRRALAQLVDPALLGVLAPAWNPARAQSRLVLRVLALALLVLALARPQWGFHWEDVHRKGLDLLVVLDTSRYIVSGATFPTYFLKKDDPLARIQMELDVTLFASKIAPFFGITRRFVGTEPNCPLTGGYNLAMQRLLPTYGVDLQIIERKQAAAGVISASRVRELIGRDDFSGLSEYVPPTTLAYLRSDEAAAIREKFPTPELSS